MVVHAINLRRLKQADLYEFKVSLLTRASFRTARASTQKNPVLKNKQKTTTTTITLSNCIMTA